MIVLNDIELIMPLRSLSLIGSGLFGVSQLYLTENYAETNEKLVIKELEEKGDLAVFDLSTDFYNFYNKWYKENPTIAITDISSVYCAKNFGLPLLTKCPHVGKFATENNVTICEPIEALKTMKANSEQINLLEYIMTKMMVN